MGRSRAAPAARRARTPDSAAAGRRIKTRADTDIVTVDPDTLRRRFSGKRGPPLLAATDSLAFDFGCVGDLLRLRQFSRSGLERIDVDDPVPARRRRRRGSDIDAARTAHQKISGAQGKAVAAQLLRIVRMERERTRRIGRAERSMGATECALARADVPIARCQTCVIRESESATMASTRVPHFPLDDVRVCRHSMGLMSA